MTQELISAFATWTFGLILLVHFQVVWSRTNMPVHVWNWCHRDKLFTQDDLLLAATSRYGAFGDLWVCPICLGQYVAFVVAAGLYTADFWFSWFGVILGILSWTGVAGKLADTSHARVQRPESPIPEVRSKELTSWAQPAPAGLQSFERGESVVQRMQVERAGKTGDIKPDPLWTALVMALHNPPPGNREAHAVAMAYLAEKDAMQAGGKSCPACQSGALIRKYMAQMYDVGIRAS